MANRPGRPSVRGSTDCGRCEKDKVEREECAEEAEGGKSNQNECA